jgi:hypothetical protein
MLKSFFWKSAAVVAVLLPSTPSQGINLSFSCNAFGEEIINNKNEIPEELKNYTGEIIKKYCTIRSYIANRSLVTIDNGEFIKYGKDVIRASENTIGSNALKGDTIAFLTLISIDKYNSQSEFQTLLCQEDVQTSTIYTLSLRNNLCTDNFKNYSIILKSRNVNEYKILAKKICGFDEKYSSISFDEISRCHSISKDNLDYLYLLSLGIALNSLRKIEYYELIKTITNEIRSEKNEAKWDITRKINQTADNIYYE